MLALTPAPLETAGERAFFAELTRWDTGGSVRAAVVASLPRFDDGPLRRRIADAVLLVPEGLAVVRVVEVERQSGTVTASPDGAWTIGPAGEPGEVLQLAGGGSSPLDGLMRAGMDTAVRLRRAGLEPGRIARLTVLVGGASGVLPEDGDLGEGDQVASLEPRSLLLGIARASRHAGTDNPRLWTTADVRAALEALELPGRGPSVEELNGEAFPYSPYVLRRPELLGSAALAAPSAAELVAPALAPQPPAARPVPTVPPVPVPPVPVPPLPVPVPAARPVMAPPLQPTAAPDPYAGLPAGDTVAVDVPAAVAESRATHETGGIGGLFAGAEPDTAATPRPRPPATVAVPVPARPATAVLTALRPPAPMPAVAPAAPVDGTRRVDEDPGRGGAGRRGLLVVVAAVVLVLAAVAAGIAALGGDPATTATDAGAGETSTAAEPAVESPVAGETVDAGGRIFTAQAVDLAASCRDHAYGQVAEFFAAADCTGLSRALWATQVEGRAAVVSVSRVRMPDTAAARDLQSLTDTSGTGNVSDLLREGVRYPGGPEALSGAEYASAVSGPVVTVVEAGWVREGAGSAADLDAIADAALALETRPFPET